MVHWLGLDTFTVEGFDSIPGWGTRIPQAVWCSTAPLKKADDRHKLYYLHILGSVSWRTVEIPQMPKCQLRVNLSNRSFLEVSDMLCYLFSTQKLKMKISKPASNENRFLRERGRGLRDFEIDSPGFPGQGDTVSFGFQVRSLLTPLPWQEDWFTSLRTT